MSRFSLADPRVQDLVESRLVPLFLASGNTAALCERLNGCLEQAGKQSRLHPNRLHTLLSADPSRGVHERTLELVQLACSRINWGQDIDPAANERRELLLLRARRDLGVAGTWHVEQLATHLGIPAAVASALLASQQQLSPPLSLDESSEPQARNTPLPDWTFQDAAVDRCMRRFAINPASKVGLVIPTGGGKTRVALRVALQILAASPKCEDHVLWVTHRRNLRRQARRELQSLLRSRSCDLPREAAQLLAQRIRFAMVSELEASIEDAPPAFLIVDEAHHAAAPSYAPIFDAPSSLPCLFLTATPNRSDGLPIGIDDVVYTITYRELAERGCIVLPKFLDFPVVNFAWSSQSVQDLADFVIERSDAEFTKTLVLAPRIDRVVEFYEALIGRLSEEPRHVLTVDDIGFAHGSANSLGCDTDLFLDTFRAKPRAILVSAQLLIEGFDDPEINAVVMTTASSSLVKLMQAAGRCVRFAQSKSESFVVQPRNDELAYHFDQRWLYQEITDHLRPELWDLGYRDLLDLRQQVQSLLTRHHVAAPDIDRILSELDRLRPGDRCHVFLSGLPYYGAVEDFHKLGEWSALLQTPATSELVRTVFNDFCAVGADIPEPSTFLEDRVARFLVRPDLRDGSTWRSLMNLLSASYFAAEELYRGGHSRAHGASRGFRVGGPTTWLRYVTFEVAASIPAELHSFLASCENRRDTEREYLQTSPGELFFLRIRLPLGGYWSYMLNREATARFAKLTIQARKDLAGLVGPQQFASLAALLSTVDPGLPGHLASRIDLFLDPVEFDNNTLSLIKGGSPP